MLAGAPRAREDATRSRHNPVADPSDVDAPRGAPVHDHLVRGYVGITDGEWYRFLAARPELTEINFWRPSDHAAFQALTPGEPFFFKTRYPLNQVVGGGFFAGFARLRVSEAWRFFGEGNGAASLAELRMRIGRYRPELMGSDADPYIGSVLIRDPTFFPSHAPHDAPPGFARNIVQGKTYDLGELRFEPYFHELLERVLGHAVELDFSEPWHHPGPVFGDPRLAPGRLGQESFKAVVLQQYGGRCAITSDRIRPVLEAAHIRPVSEGGEHRVDNGLLLRSDVHTLFDRGYLGVDQDHRLLVSRRLREEFENGEEFYARAGTVIELPRQKIDRPNRRFLEWHLGTVFKAS